MGGSRGQRHGGFTLIELLVVIAIIGVLVALLLPAVQKVRESANRMSCENNLKQLGLALQNYHGQNQCFPPGWLSITTPDSNNGWIARILPYIEQEPLYRQIDFSVDWTGNDASGVNGTRINLLRCPSAPAKRDETTHSMTDYSATNVYTQTGVDLSQWYKDSAAFNNGGVLLSVSIKTPSGDTTGNRITDILDGTSNTIMVGECAGRNKHWILGELDSGTVTGGSWNGPWAGNNMIKVEGYDPATRTRGKQPLPPCAVNCINSDEIYAFHPAGANVLMADGSVHLLKVGTDIVLLRALITIRAREQVTPDF